MDKIQGSAFDIIMAIRGMLMNDGQYHFSTKSQQGSGDDAQTLDKTIGATLYKIKNGERQPMNKTIKNPMLEAPTAMAQRYFGQLPQFKVSMDAVMPKIAGIFHEAQQGAGMSGFNFSNLSNFAGGAMQLTDAISTIMTGGETSGLSNAASTMTTAMQGLTSIVADLTGAQAHSLIDLTQPSQSIPFMSAMSQALGGASSTIFSTDIFSTGYTIAAEVNQYLQQQSGGSIQYSNILNQIANETQINNIVLQLETMIIAIENANAGMTPNQITMLINAINTLSTYGVSDAFMIQINSLVLSLGSAGNGVNIILDQILYLLKLLGNGDSTYGNSQNSLNNAANQGTDGNLGNSLSGLMKAGQDVLNMLGITPSQQQQNDQQAQAESDQTDADGNTQKKIVGRMKVKDKDAKQLGTLYGQQKQEYKNNPD